MKKIISIIISLLCVVSLFSACSGTSKDENKALQNDIKKAFSKTQKLKSINSYSSSELAFGEEFSNMNTVKTVTSLMESNIGNNDKYEMSTEVELFINGTSNSTYETYYKGGYFYTNKYMGSFKTKIAADELRKDTEIAIPQIKVEDMKSLEIKDDNKYSFAIATNELGEGLSLDDCKIIDFTCKNSVVRKQVEEALKNSGTQFADVEIVSGKGKYVINKKGYLVSAELEMKANVVTDGETGSTVVKTIAEYVDVGKKIDPYDPEDEKHTEIDNLEDIAYLDSAMSAALSNPELYTTMDSSATINVEKENINSGYERTYVRKYSTEKQEYLQETKTLYLSDGEENGPYLSAGYYTDGTYYSASDTTKLYIKSDMDFASFAGVIYAGSATSPADMYSPGIMKSIKKEEKGEELLFTYELNTQSESGIKFIGSLFGPYSETFGGDIETAEKQVKSFKATSYVNKDGVYYKTVMSCELLLKFEEGDVTIKAEQLVNVYDSDKMGVIEFPEFKNYERMDSSALLSGYANAS